jgi:hypothetical protein
VGSARDVSEASSTERKQRSGVGAKRQRSEAAKASADTEYEMERSWREAPEERNEILSRCTGTGWANGGKQNATY